MRSRVRNGNFTYNLCARVVDQRFGNWNYGRASFVPRLFQLCDKSGRLLVEEIVNFTQESLDGDDVMILDAYDKIYVWIGKGASVQEKAEATNTAKAYIQQNALWRHVRFEIIKVQQGSEPDSFKDMFRSWNDGLFQKNARSVESIKQSLFNR